MAVSFQLVIDCADPEPLALLGRHIGYEFEPPLDIWNVTRGGDYWHVYGHLLEGGKRAAADSTSQVLLGA